MDLPELEKCPLEFRHGYPECDCDLVGGDSSCTKKPTYAEVCDQYLPLRQRERQLDQALSLIRAQQELLRAYRKGSGHEICVNNNGFPSRFRGEEDDRCETCKANDALLPPIEEK